jgi:hypothetical protein
MILNRLSEQEVWNATLSNLRWDAQTETALREWGVDEFFEGLAAVFPYEKRGPLKVPKNSAFTPEERKALTVLVGTLNKAWDNSRHLTGEAFIDSDWTLKIAAEMRRATDVMKKRGGFFSTVREEAEPSISGATDFPTTVFMPLKDEGVDVWRPVDAQHLGDGRYRILGPVPNGETWAFEPGAIVPCEWKKFEDGAGGMTVLTGDH